MRINYLQDHPVKTGYLESKKIMEKGEKAENVVFFICKLNVNE
jgi:hypothetical protein